MNTSLTRFTTLASAALGLALAGIAGAEGAAPDTVATKYKQLHALTDQDGHPASTERLAKGPDGNFYGTTTSGGDAGGGTAYRMTPKGQVKVMHSFGGHGDGRLPQGLTYRPADGRFYGITADGGGDDCGTFYRMGLDGSVTVLHEFGLDRSGLCDPQHVLLLSSDGDFYGVTTRDKGAVYRITADGVATVVHRFANDGDGGGWWPSSHLIEDRAGRLYGATRYFEPVGSGTAYRLTKAGVVTYLHRFGTSGDGTFPEAGLVLVGSMLYGTTEGGGAFDLGTVYRVSTSGAYQLMHSFGPLGSAPPRAPTSALVRAPDGYLYGTTQVGGEANRGTIYRVTLEGQLTLLHSFGVLPGDGYECPGDLLLDGKATFYGTTRFGGAENVGTIFKLAVAN